MKKKIVLVLAVLLTSAAALSLILATSRYVGFLRHPEALHQLRAFQVSPVSAEVEGLTVRVLPLWGDTANVSPLLVSVFWMFEVSVANDGVSPVDVDFDRVTLAVAGREVNALAVDAVLRLFNERMTGAYGTAAGRRGYQQALDQLQAQGARVTRVFPGYTRKTMVLFQPHPGFPEDADITLRGIRTVRDRRELPLTFHLHREAGIGGTKTDGNQG